MEFKAKIRVVVLLAIAALSVTACGGGAQYTPIDVDAARALHTQVSTFYQGTQDLLTEASTQISTIDTLPSGVRPQDFEIQLVKSALMACYNDEINITSMTT
ncbi:MAG: hypothetical protein KC561_19195, partial [Myxococcales bacterium]|nr:hypothetical protein [Myxococcales bacterium]